MTTKTTNVNRIPRFQKHVHYYKLHNTHEATNSITIKTALMKQIKHTQNEHSPLYWNDGALLIKRS